MSRRPTADTTTERHVRLHRAEGDVLVRVVDVAAVDTRHDEDFDAPTTVSLQLARGGTLVGHAVVFVDVPTTDTLGVSPYLRGFAATWGIDAFVRDDDRFLPRLASAAPHTASPGATA